MKSLPIRRAQFKTADFAAWLARNGAEIGKPTNAYEVIRYKAWAGATKRAETHIVYAKENGLLTFTGASQAHYIQFQTGAQMYPTPESNPFHVPRQARGNPPGGWVRPDGGPFRKDAETSASAQAKRRQRLIERDGADCWFCGVPLGDDITIEHLVPKSEGGRNTLANYALAHQRCNLQAANLPLVKKIALRAEMRARDSSSDPLGRRPEGAPGEASQSGPNEDSGIAHTSPPADPATLPVIPLTGKTPTPWGPELSTQETTNADR